MSFQLTEEQQKVVTAFNKGGDLVIQAGAGAGKTSTLKQLAKAQPNRKGLYMAYNKAIQMDAQASFPSSVTCKTNHGLAFGPVGRRFIQRIKTTSRQSGTRAARILGINSPVHIGKDMPPVSPAQQARMAKAAVKRFCYSADGEITRRHIARPQGYSDEAYAALVKAVLPAAQDAWADLSTPEGELKSEHDHYLKIWALSRPQLPYDYLLYDECQDANDVMTGVVMNQKHAQKIAVGDSSQAIYGWRGATDALAKFPGTQLTLSQSFRFGPAIADHANTWLNLLDAPLRLTGFKEINSRVEPLSRPDAILTRTNAGAMGVAMRHMGNGRKVAIVRGGGEIRLLAEAAIDLKAGIPTDHPELVAFPTWEAVKDFVAFEDDGADLRPMVNLIEEYGPDAIIQATETLADESRAEIIVSTAHKAKGREWGSVKIHSDFEEPKANENGDVLIRRDEAMLIYVAVTRGRQLLDAEALGWAHRLDGTR